MKTGIELITEERQRQISQEGWTPENDDKYEHGQLAAAAVTYTDTHLIRHTYKEEKAGEMIADLMMDRWPWDEEWFKPTSSIRDLTKAGALIAAEIDRLQRLNSQLNQPRLNPVPLLQKLEFEWIGLNPDAPDHQLWATPAMVISVPCAGCSDPDIGRLIFHAGAAAARKEIRRAHDAFIAAIKV